MNGVELFQSAPHDPSCPYAQPLPPADGTERVVEACTCTPTVTLSESRPDAMAYYADSDPFDKFPWTWAAYTAPFQDGPEGHLRGFICTPNGKRIDNGEQHTYWSVAGDIWEPIGIIICKAVNAEAARRYGTPNPESVYTDEWKATLS